MDAYIYLIGGVIFLVPTLIICYYRKDLRQLTMIGGLCGGLAALITEPIFTRDYWLVPNLLGWHRICFEDFIFGFGLTAFIAILYPAAARLKFSGRAVKKMRFGVYGAFAVASLVSVYLFIFVLGVNSVVVSTGLCYAFMPIIWILRRDLIKPSLIIAASVVLIVLVMYIVFFDVITPHWWDKYWLLTNTHLGVTVFGNVPVTELLWYSGWALFASVIWPFSMGRIFEPLTAARAHQKHTQDRSRHGRLL